MILISRVKFEQFWWTCLKKEINSKMDLKLLKSLMIQNTYYGRYSIIMMLIALLSSESPELSIKLMKPSKSKEVCETKVAY